MSSPANRFFIIIFTGMVVAQAFLFAGSKEFYYSFPISPFAKVEVASDENHPDFAWAECKDNKLYAKSSRTYGTARDEITLDLVSGVLSGSSNLSGMNPQANFVIRAPDQGGDYFTYLDKLAEMERIFKFTKSRKAEKYIRRIMSCVKKLNVADAARAFIDCSNLVLGLRNKIMVEYQVKTDRDILLSFCDKKQCYAKKRASIKAGAGKTAIELELPLTVSDMESTYISLHVVPPGAERTQSVAEAIVNRKSEAGDRIFNLYVTNVDDQGHADPALYAGKNNEIYTNWRVAGNRDIILKLVDQEGRVWVDNKFFASSGGENSKKVQLFIPENTPPGTGYKIIERIVPQGGSWEENLTEEALDDWGRGIAVK